MMGIGPDECGRLDLWTYGALLWNWNQAHDPDANKPRGAVDVDRLRRFTSAHIE